MIEFAVDDTPRNHRILTKELPALFGDNLSYIPTIKHRKFHEHFLYVVVFTDGSLDVEIALKFPRIMDNIIRVFHNKCYPARMSPNSRMREVLVNMPSPVDEIKLYMTTFNNGSDIVIDWTASESECIG